MKPGIVQFPQAIKLMEVGPRDGLQNETVLVSTASKIAFIEALVEAGARRIEVTSFVNPKWIPQLADQFEVAKGIARQPGVSYAALVPNMKGYENAVSCGINEVGLVIAASESHNKKNLNASTQEVLQRYQEVVSRAKEENIPFRIYISCAFGCPFEGNIDTQKVIDLASQSMALGAYEISLGDTIGVGNPKQVIDLLESLHPVVSVNQIALHLHDTRGTALANILAGLMMGVSSFDASAGGLGGCPYAPGASGNVASEDVVYMCQQMGIETGYDLGKLCQASKEIEKTLNRKLPAKMLALCRS